ncbi:hypothetical protein KY327_01995 [Candidatus Woesearchaeota archaeon]|nr:hypothetical protein [Candidatus Woesearchaeota archaeon]
MAKKRERLEIVKDILAAVRDKDGIGSTRLLYASNLSPQMHRDYLQELLRKQLLHEEQHKGKKKYRITEKGLKYLQRYEGFARFVDEIGL